MTELTINQRFAIFLDKKKISQKIFSDTTGIDKGTVSNIFLGDTKSPKADFFQAFVRHYPEINLRWLLIGEGQMFLPEGQILESPMVAKEPDSPKIDGSNEVLQKLIDTVSDLSKALADQSSARKAADERLEKVEWKVLELERQKETMARELESLRGGG